MSFSLYPTLIALGLSHSCSQTSPRGVRCLNIASLLLHYIGFRGNYFRVSDPYLHGPVKLLTLIEG